MLARASNLTTIMDEALRRHLTPLRPQQLQTTRQALNYNYSLYVSLPYHPSLSKPLKTILGQHDIKVTHSSSTTLRDLLTKTKTTSPPHLTPNTFYEISCLYCPSTHDGQTYRPLIDRMKEQTRTMLLLQSQHEQRLRQHS